MLKNSFDPLKDNLYKGDNLKKRALKDLILKTMNNQKRCFLNWANFNNTQKKITQVKTIYDAFEKLNNIFEELMIGYMTIEREEGEIQCTLIKL